MVADLDIEHLGVRVEGVEQLGQAARVGVLIERLTKALQQFSLERDTREIPHSAPMARLYEDDTASEPVVSVSADCDELSHCSLYGVFVDVF